ncbi:MAG: hypothetical protein Q8K79_03560 [Solirubrobacteraceae bacterium]|nr:hypothetical protein [Solirubrobacteraceae bacterium]
MEGGVTVILALFVLVGGIAGAVALFGAGGYVQRRREKGELSGASAEPRPRHTVVEDDSDDVLVPQRTTKDTQGPE